MPLDRPTIASRQRPGPERSALLASIALHGAVLVALVAGVNVSSAPGDAASLPTIELVFMPAQPAAPPLSQATDASSEAPTPPETLPATPEQVEPEAAQELRDPAPPADAAPDATAVPIPAIGPVLDEAPPERHAPPPPTKVAKPAPAPTRVAARPRPKSVPDASVVADTTPSSPVAPGERIGQATARSDIAAALAPAAGPPVITRAQYRERPMPPVYPRRAREMNITGTTVLRALVDRDGRTREVRVWRSSGSEALDEAAATAARRWAFAPAQIDGRTVEAWVEIPVNFELR